MIKERPEASPAAFLGNDLGFLSRLKISSVARVASVSDLIPSPDDVCILNNDQDTAETTYRASLDSDQTECRKQVDKHENMMVEKP